MAWRYCILLQQRINGASPRYRVPVGVSTRIAGLVGRIESNDKGPQLKDPRGERGELPPPEMISDGLPVA